jgi:hypothetical protein
MSFWVVAMFWWSLPSGNEGSPSHYAPRDLSEFHIPYPVRYYDTDAACLADIPKRRADLTLPDAASGTGLNGFTCIRLRLEEVSQLPPVAP